jgi:hypothetical protein
MAGNANSGRYARGSVGVKPSKMVRMCGKQGWRVIGATLATAERDIENLTFVPTKAVLDTAWDAVWQAEGKPTIKVDQETHLTLNLDPSKLLEAMRERELIEAEYTLLPDSLTTSQNMQYTTTPSCVVPDWEVGCRGEDPLRNVSDRPENFILYPSELNIMEGE